MNKAKKKSKQNFLFGYISGFLSVSVCQPLDLCKVRLGALRGIQSQQNSQNSHITAKKFIQNIYKREGIKGFYQGYVPTIIAQPVFQGIFFTTYHFLKPVIKEKFQQNYMITNMISSCLAGIISDVFTNPLWVVKTRMQTQALHDSRQKLTFFETFITIYQNEGFKAFYKGLGTSMFGISHAIINFTLYDYFKTNYKSNINTDSKFIVLYSLTSKTILFTYPHVLIRTRLVDSRQKNTKISQQILKVYKREGLRGFYAGMGFDLIRAIPNNIIQFYTFEYLSQNYDQVL